MVSQPNGKVNIGSLDRLRHDDTLAYSVTRSPFVSLTQSHSIPAESLSHVLYSFANLRDDGEVVLTDSWADQEQHYDGDSWQDQGTNLYGHLKQLFLLKQKHRHLKVLLSIGGWTYSPRFAQPMSTPQGRARFVESSVRLLEDYGFDGLDVDWEYPKDDREAVNYVELLRELRLALDRAAAARGMQQPHGFDLSIAAPCGPQNYEKLKLREMDQYLSFWSLMAYDYSGSWDSIANHQAGLFSSSGMNTDAALRYFTSHGVPVHKLVLGIPLYGRSFLNCAGPGRGFAGVGQGSWEQGTYDFKALPLPGSTEHVDHQAVAASCFEPTKREWVSYDNVETATRKAQFVAQNGLAGAMHWELSGDRKEDGASIVKAVATSMGGPLDSRSNCLEYPHSKFDNLRNGMR